MQAPTPLEAGRTISDQITAVLQENGMNYTASEHDIEQYKVIEIKNKSPKTIKKHLEKIALHLGVDE